MKPGDMNAFETAFTIVFFVTWIGLAIGSFFLFYRGKNVAFKRRWFPRFAILAGVLFTLFSTTILSFSGDYLTAQHLERTVVPEVRPESA